MNLRDSIFIELYSGDHRAKNISDVFSKHEIKFDKICVLNIIAYIDSGFEEEGHGFAKRKSEREATYRLASDLFSVIDNTVAEVARIKRDAKRLGIWNRLNDLTLFSLNTFQNLATKLQHENTEAKKYAKEKMMVCKPGRVRAVGYDDYFDVIDGATFNSVDATLLPVLAKDLDFLLPQGFRGRQLGTWRVRCKQYFKRHPVRPKPWSVRECAWLEGAIDEVIAERTAEREWEIECEAERYAEEEEAAYYAAMKVNNPEH